LREALTSAVKRYATHVDSAGCVTPIVERNSITATEAVLAICELMRAADLKPVRRSRCGTAAVAEVPMEARRSEVLVGALASIADGDHRIYRVGTLEVGVFRQGEKVFAWENRCPHAGRPGLPGKDLPQGRGSARRERKSLGLRFGSTPQIVCPWHGFEFDVATGRHPGDSRYRPEARRRQRCATASCMCARRREPGTGVPGLERGIAILRLFRPRSHASRAPEVAAELGIPALYGARLLLGPRDARLLRQEPRGVFALGPGVLSLGFEVPGVARG
jgi:nitrite reductase/ring-hydroxylating ferredoxin subunit